LITTLIRTSNLTPALHDRQRVSAARRTGGGEISTGTGGWSESAAVRDPIRWSAGPIIFRYKSEETPLCNYLTLYLLGSWIRGSRAGRRTYY